MGLGGCLTIYINSIGSFWVGINLDMYLLLDIQSWETLGCSDCDDLNLRTNMHGKTRKAQGFLFPP